MFNKKCVLLLLLILLLLLSVGSVCATDPNNTDSLTTVGDNSLELNNNTVLCDSDKVFNLTNDSSVSTVPCAVSSYISVMESYNKTVSVETGIKETHTVNNVTSVDGLVNAFTNQGLKSNVIKTKSIEYLKELHKNKTINIIVHMFIDGKYHYAHIKQVRKDGILFNNNWFVTFNVLKQHYNNIAIIVTNESLLSFNCSCEYVNKFEWVNITGELSEKALFKYNIGLIDTSISAFSKYSKLKENIKDDGTKRSFDFLEHVLFGDTLKPKMANVLTIKKKLKPVIADSNVPDNLLRNFNNALTPMQKNLNETIRHLNYLSDEIIMITNQGDNLKSSNVVVNPIKQVDIPNLLGECGEAITENPILKRFVKNFEDSVNNLNPLNAHPELREKLDQKYGLEHHKFGFIDYYTLKNNRGE